MVLFVIMLLAVVKTAGGGVAEVDQAQQWVGGLTEGVSSTYVLMVAGLVSVFPLIFVVDRLAGRLIRARH